MPTPTAIVPTYRAVAIQFLPMQHGDGRRFLTNPAVCGSSEPGVVFGNVMCLSGRYYVTGPAFPADDEPAMRRVALGGSAVVQRFNRQQQQPQQIYVRTTHSAALTVLWELLTAHFGIVDAAEQVQEHELRHRAHEEVRARQESLKQWSNTIDQAHETNGNNPAINNPDDWIPDYPLQPEELDEELTDNQDSEEQPEYPEDEQHNYLDDTEQDAEAEVLGDLYNSQFEG